MKIGIISMQRVANNGSFLQSYGLKKMIESLGHEVVFIDYKVGRPIMRTTTDKFRYCFLKVRNWFVHLFMDMQGLQFLLPMQMRNIVNFRKEYSETIVKHLGVNKKFKYHTPVDALVIGSDEVFNCTQINPEVGFSPELFGAHANTKKIISYAGSFGNTTVSKLKDFGKMDELRSYFRKFDAVSVRDRNSAEVIKALIGKEPELNLDPVLMYDFMSNIKRTCAKKDFIIVYAYRARITDEEAKEIVGFARSQGKKLISVSGEMDFCDEHFKGDPFEGLDLYRNADYVITDTFHGTIFSVINRKKFVTLIRESKGSSYGNQEKLQDLLYRLGLQSRAFSHGDDCLSDKMLPNIDYDAVFKILEKEREHAMEYLRGQLNLEGSLCDRK